jgi:hypothetical protein
MLGRVAIVTVATFLDGNLAKITDDDDDAEALLFSEEKDEEPLIEL